jgi:oligosaccharide repeat unit polymerase
MLRTNLHQLAILSYVGPALLAVFLAPAYGYSFSPHAVFVILASVAATLSGVIASELVRRRNPKRKRAKLSSQLYRAIAYALIAAGSTAMILNFMSIGSVPLLAKGAGRIAMSANALWNIYIFCGLGLFVYATQIRQSGKPTALGNILSVLYISLAIASAWKGTALFMLTMLATPLMRGRHIKISHVIFAGVTLTLFFFSVNWMRSSNNSFADLINQPIYYLIWGFVNFDVEAIGHISNCFHSIPGLGCKFEVDNSTLLIPAFNTYSALAPLYLDGGVLLVLLVFFFVSFFLGVSTSFGDGLFTNYVFFLCVYFLFLAHNGYMLYSKTYIACLALLAAISLLVDLAKARKM